MHLEKQLNQAIKSGNVEAIDNVFEKIYYEYGKLVAFIISKYVSKKEDVEELVDDCFIAFFNKIKTERINNIKYYLVTISKNKAIDFIRKNERLVDVVYSDEYVLNKTGNKQHFYDEIIEILIPLLTEYEINVILLKDYYCYSLSDIARHYNKPARTVNSTYHRAIKKIKKEWKND